MGDAAASVKEGKLRANSEKKITIQEDFVFAVTLNPSLAIIIRAL